MHASKLIGVLVILVLAWVLAAPSARADDVKDQAKRDVAAALAAQNAGHYDEAIALYKRAYAAIPHPEILFDLGQAYRLQGDAETALSYYRRYLAAEPNGRAARDATRWVADLSKAIADQQRDPARKAGPDHKAEPTRKAEPHTVATDHPPEAARKTTAARGAEVEPKPAPATTADPRPTTAPAPPAPPPAVPSSPVGAAATAQPAAQPRAEATPARYWTATWISAAGGASALIGGLVVGGLARSKQNAAIAICGADRVCDSDSDTRRADALLAQSRTRGTISTTLVVVGAGGLAASGALWWLGRRDDSTRPVVAPIVAPGAIGVAVGGAF